MALIEKSLAVTVSVTVVVWVADGPVPVIVTVLLPVVAVAVAVKVSVELPPDEVMGLALKLAVTPLGSGLVLSVTVCAEPLVSVVVTVLAPVLPWLTLTGLVALIEKSFAGALTGSDTSSKSV